MEKPKFTKVRFQTQEGCIGERHDPETGGVC